MDFRDQLALACILIRAINHNSRQSSSRINTITTNYYYRTLLPLILALFHSACLTVLKHKWHQRSTQAFQTPNIDPVSASGMIVSLKRAVGSAFWSNPVRQINIKELARTERKEEQQRGREPFPVIDRWYDKEEEP